MKIKIIAVGRLKDAYLRALQDDYAKRLSRYCKLEIVEVDDSPNRPGEEERAMLEEWTRIKKHIKGSEFLVPLEVEGKQMSSKEFSISLEKWSIEGKGEIVFLIGGSLGLHENAKKEGDFAVSFSKMTLTHGFARGLLLEQIYRAFKIAKGEPYDK